ncbi:tetratricopeptide repeat-containing sulfotransferase family protein [Acidocella aquatica]|uniref:tetratricopeptide repeat-containing sulfotransferase family protein n=1 Tax=Acidocella aquatica TaxID=1922313 RepID=UPI0024E09C8B|nr:tetratricopeptide repeat-containing sulfotransferase family protein [Acidocella aquatica]
MTQQKLDDVLCRCGSGLRRVRCCDADISAWPGGEAVDALDAQGQEAVKLFNEKKYVEAEALALKLLDLAPNLRPALRVLFEIRKAQKRGTAEEALAIRLAALPGAPAVRAAANLLLAQYYVGQGRYALARPPAAEAVMATPRDATAQHVLGVVLTESGALQAGERHYRRALAVLGRDDGVVLANLAWNLKLQGRLDDAVVIYEQALALRPDNRRGQGGYAQAEFARGNREKALRLLDDGLARWPDDRALRLLRAMADLAMGDAEAVLARLSNAPETLLSAELCTRGQALARLGRPVEAVQHYATAKLLQRERHGQQYQAEAFAAKAEACKAYFTAERVQPLPRAVAPPARQPVFLLGFARSGSSLLEQLLGQVPGFAAGDEFFPVAELNEIIPALAGAARDYPEALDHALVGDGWALPERLRQRYEEARNQLGLARPGVQFITDRSASNHWQLGLIKLLFPDAPVIHVLRHPLDVMLSNLGQDRRLEANCGVSMLALARHYALVMSLIRHFRGQLTLRYLPVRYEDLVSDTAASLRRVVEFAGADPAAVPPEAVLRANSAMPPGPVPAHFSGREAVHGRGLYRHRAYQTQMPALFAEVREILDPWIAELGYREDGP